MYAHHVYGNKKYQKNYHLFFFFFKQLAVKPISRFEMCSSKKLDKYMVKQKEKQERILLDTRLNNNKYNRPNFTASTHLQDRSIIKPISMQC